ncbi:Hydantoinase/oxoprolinase N-terminal region-domain-containing protein [Favolaschia claudopus]|uniref:Hydantoinase/oxoprolinase N-terminal region-domain-containing protein n=1 Tax=Favolaschia claudopus TaxID=2862362 RepID=A0AAW0DNH1_9AGAR
MGTYRIGVDVGGTNTDGVLLDPSCSPDKGVRAWHKSPTTQDPSHGIQTVIKTLLETAKIDLQEVASVTVGTTHFINAVLEKDQNRLAPVAVIRLCGPFSRDVYPAIDWPEDLRNIVCKYCGFVDGVLDAYILPFARSTLSSFERAVARLHLCRPLPSLKTTERYFQPD